MNFEFRELSAPFGVQLEITGDCNNRCCHCYNYWRDDFNVQEKSLNKEAFLRVIDELAKAKIFYVTITGGEPLLKKELFYAIMEKLAEYEIGFSLNSNLVNLTEVDIKTMKRFGLKSILTSIHSHVPEKHDEIANHQGSFVATIENIQRLTCEKFNVKVNTVITSKNYKDVFLIGKLLSQIKVSGFFATRFLPPVRQKDFSEIKPSKDQIKEAFSALLKVQKEFSFSIGSLVAYPYCFLYENSRLHQLTKRSCNAGITVASIESTGFIRACPNSEVRYGHILKEGLVSAWHKMSSWRKGEYIPKQCLDCFYRTSCRGGCRAEGMKLGKLDEPDSLMEKRNFVDLLESNELIGKNLTVDVLFSVNPKIKYREESFGYVVAGKNLQSPALLSKKFFEFLIKVKNRKNILLRNLLKEWGVNLIDVREFFSYLAEKGVITLEKLKGGENNGSS